MRYRKVAMAVALCVVFCVLLAAVDNHAYAAGKSVKMEERKGIGQSLGNKEIDKKKLATKGQMFLGIGSVIATIVALKYW